MKRDKKHIPNPGSIEAQKMGCACPVIDNEHGKGIRVKGEQLFWINDECALHGAKRGGHNG